jgi:hypothetical protein
MRMILFLLLLAVVALGVDAVLFNGGYSQAVWRTLSQYTLELRGPTSPAPPETPTPTPPNPG